MFFHGRRGWVLVGLGFVCSSFIGSVMRAYWGWGVLEEKKRLLNEIGFFMVPLSILKLCAKGLCAHACINTHTTHTSPPLPPLSLSLSRSIRIQAAGTLRKVVTITLSYLVSV